MFGTAPSDFALEVARLIQPGDYVLDLGCGEGRDSVFFATLGAVVTGVDLSADGIAKGKRLARARGVRVSWWPGSMTEMLPPGRFDLIYSCGSLHYVPRQRRTALFARLQAMTRRDGRQAHLVFTRSLVHEEKGERVEYFESGELHASFIDWQILTHGERVIHCALDGTVHGHAVEQLTAQRPHRAP